MNKSLTLNHDILYYIQARGAAPRAKPAGPRGGEGHAFKIKYIYTSMSVTQAQASTVSAHTTAVNCQVNNKRSCNVNQDTCIDTVCDVR